MSSMIGENIKLSIFGESHGKAIGVVIDGLPSGEAIDFDEILNEMARRAPGKDKTSTARKETDYPEVLSGIYDGKTTGSPLAVMIKNSDAHSGDYANLLRFPRPGHADFASKVRYDGFCDYRGGGHFSGRLTAPMVFAGAVAKQILNHRGIYVGAHILSVGSACDNRFDMVGVSEADLKNLHNKTFPVISDDAEKNIRAEIENARLDGDSIGGIVECAVVGYPSGIGDPIFGGIENKLSQTLFGIPAVKGIEFGAGFETAKMRGSENNDPYYIDNGEVKTKTNNHGGILGGISSGMPIVLRLAFKPTPSIYKEQQTVDLVEMKEEPLIIKGRHDPCVVVRAVPVVEAMTAFCLCDMLNKR